LYFECKNYNQQQNVGETHAMPSELIDLTADIVIAHASVTEMSSEDLLREIKAVYATLEGLAIGGRKASPIEISDQRSGKSVKRAEGALDSVVSKKKVSVPETPVLTIKEAFKPDQVACMICGKAGMKTLKRHLSSAHKVSPGQYRKQFSIPSNQPLVASEYVDKRRQIAADRGLGDKLAAARAAKNKKRTRR
jgi:predicted transcriptional regulator